MGAIKCACCVRLFSEQDVSNEPMYGVVDCEHEDDEDDVYGRLVDRHTTKTKVKLLSPYQ